METQRLLRRRPLDRHPLHHRLQAPCPPSASVAVSGAHRDLTAVPANERGPVETVTLAGIGAIALVAQHADELASEIAARVGVERDEVRSVIADVLDSWRREAARLGESGGSMAAKAASELGAASRDAVSDLELRVAQIEHRLKLLERDST
jgi:polyhydroxyalkanoate synthesis regulator phasin